MCKITLQSRLTLVPLIIREDQKNYIVQETDTGEFFEMPKICIDAIVRIKKGAELVDLERELKEHYPEEDVNVLDFVQNLLDLGLILEVDGVAVGHREGKKVQNNSFSWIHPKVAGFLFNTVSTKLFFLFFIINLYIFIKKPELFPDYQDLFITHSMLANSLLWLFISFLVIINHELGHIFAIRAHDLPTKIGVGHRLFFVVLETDMTPAWGLSKKQRNVLYLAGIGFDSILLFLALMVQLLMPASDGIISIAKIVSLYIVINMIYQCAFFMKTDIYYVFENITGCYNLMENAKIKIRKVLPFLKAEKHTTVYKGEEAVVWWYSIFYITGIGIVSFLYIYYFLPQFYYAISHAIRDLSEPITTAHFWDSFIFIGVTLTMIGLLFFSWSKTYLPTVISNQKK